VVAPEHKGLHFDHYEALWQWSTEEFEAFWESIWEYAEMISHHHYQRVVNKLIFEKPLSLGGE